MSEADEKLRQAVEGQRGLYPKEYRSRCIRMSREGRRLLGRIR